jgi:uncharacterized protein YqjF (DUF2071 family)
MVGFLFDDSRLFGRIPIPFHRSFEEVNLRFYVRRHVGGTVRRGVVFVKELAASRSVAVVANAVFHERYQRVPMRHTVVHHDAQIRNQGGRFSYAWKDGPNWSELWAITEGPIVELAAGSLQAFITEHYWGYTRRKVGVTLEFRVEHPRWRVWTARECGCQADFGRLYGPEFVEPLNAQPHSALVADGSDVIVFRPRPLLDGSAGKD